MITGDIRIDYEMADYGEFLDHYDSGEEYSELEDMVKEQKP